MNPKILGLIPARGGSKGVPRKNIKELCGKPLINYTIEAALQSRYLTRVVVTTDDAEIAEISLKAGAAVPFLRPAELAGDSAKAIGVVQHAVSEMENLDGCTYDVIAYLEPPSPLRETTDIDTAIELFLEHKPDSVISVVEANHYHPILMKQIVDGYVEPLWKPEPEGVPRQLYTPKAYMRNGVVYVVKRDNIMKGVFYGEKIIPYIMPESRSVCIDEMNDWYLAEVVMKRKLGILD